MVFDQNTNGLISMSQIHISVNLCSKFWLFGFYINLNHFAIIIKNFNIKQKKIVILFKNSI